METAISGLRRHLDLIEDGLLAVSLTLLVWIQVLVPPRLLLGRPPGPRFGGEGILIFRRVEPTILTFALIAACFLPLTARRMRPEVVFGLTSTAYVFYQLTRNPQAFLIVGVLIALYSLATVTDRRTLALWGVPFGLLVLLVSVPDVRETIFFAEVVRNLSLLAAAALLGDATRNRRAYISEVERRAAEAERTREEEAARRVDEERLRIARELHDITAHSLSIVAVQSAAASHVIDSDPAEAKRSLVAIRETSRSALQELRSMLGVLRGSDEAIAPLAPAPGLARLDELVRPLADAGLAVDVRATGEDVPIPAFVDASAYRIVQEAFTNVLRHAGGCHVTVAVERSEDSLRLEVTDDGAAQPEKPIGQGHGVTGMRERAVALGGTFDAGPLPEGGWRVVAVLPTDGRVL